MTKWRAGALWTLTAVVVVIAGTEIGFRQGGKASEEASRHLIGVILSGSCEKVPGARGHYIGEALKYSLLHPVELPPWWVFRSVIKSMNQKPDPIAEAVCRQNLPASHQTQSPAS